MPTPDTRAHLAALYAGADDPWNTHASPYEQQKFAQTIASIPRHRYRRGLEVGCGAGALTARLAARCDVLVAMDCTARALAVARARTSRANVVFTEGAAPVTWPAQPPDLVVLSEVLYFLTDDESAGLAARLAQDCAAQCDVVLVNWLGRTGGGIGGAAAARRLIGMLAGTHHRLLGCGSGQFEIDVLRRNARHQLTGEARAGSHDSAGCGPPVNRSEVR